MEKRVIDPDFVTKLRLFTRPQGKKPSCLDKLNDEELTEVWHMLHSRSKKWSFNAISRHIKEVWGALPDNDEGWIADKLRAFSDQAVRGVSIPRAPQNSEEEKVRDRMKKREHKARNQLDVAVELGEAMLVYKDEILYWTQRGQERGEPFDRYINDLGKTMGYLATVRDEHMVKAGLMRPQASQLDVTVRQAHVMLTKNLDDSKQVTSLASAFKKGLEAISEPLQIQKLIPATIVSAEDIIQLVPEYETELQYEDGELAACPGPADFADSGSGPEQPESEDI